MNNFERYEKQLLFKPIGLNGQKILSDSKVGILGVGALGTHILDNLARTGIGEIHIADSDQIELSNLQRQILFTEGDVGSYKVQAAKNKIEQINSEVNVICNVTRVNSQNFNQIFNGLDLIFDATDNFETRFLLNDMAIKYGFPWLHSGVTASNGQSILFIPGKTACYRCIVKDLPNMQEFPTVHNSGILNSIVNIISSISSASALKYLLDNKPDFSLKYYDAWDHIFHKFDYKNSSDCEHCKHLFKE